MREGANALQVAKDQSEEELAHLKTHIKSCYKSLSEHKGHTGGK